RAVYLDGDFYIVGYRPISIAIAAYAQNSGQAFKYPAGRMYEKKRKRYAHTRRTCRKRAAVADLRDRYQILEDNRQLSLRKDCTPCRWVVRLTQTWQPRDSGNTDQRHVFISLS
ncbi:unnamed protein product, partial [Heterotrigona itama]